MTEGWCGLVGLVVVDVGDAVGVGVQVFLLVQEAVSAVADAQQVLRDVLGDVESEAVPARPDDGSLTLGSRRRISTFDPDRGQPSTHTDYNQCPASGVRGYPPHAASKAADLISRPLLPPRGPGTTN